MADFHAGDSNTISPRSTTSTIPPAIFADPTTRIIDESLQGHMASLPRLPLDIPLTSGHAHDVEATVYPQSSFMLSLATSRGDWTSSTYHVIYHNSPPMKDDEDIQDKLAVEFHRLSCLGRMKFGLEGGPVHLDGVRVGLDAIERCATLLKG